jgi:isoleucyl-tRNA synthetase
VRLVQDARKASAFDVTDRVQLWWAASDELARHCASTLCSVADEVLAVAYEEGRRHRRGSDVRDFTDDELGLRFWLARREA